VLGDGDCGQGNLTVSNLKDFVGKFVTLKFTTQFVDEYFDINDSDSYFDSGFVAEYSDEPEKFDLIYHQDQPHDRKAHMLGGMKEKDIEQITESKSPWARDSIDQEILGSMTKYNLTFGGTKSTVTKKSNSCVRCGGELYKKETVDFKTGAPCFIDKCKACGYC
jgi:hypothetical protein